MFAMTSSRVNQPSNPIMGGHPPSPSTLSASQQSPSIPTASQPSLSNPDAPAPASVERLPLIMDESGMIVGPSQNASAWSSKSGEYVRKFIPIHLTNWKTMDPTFKNDLWNTLMGEFSFNVREDFARPFCEVRFDDIWRTHKTRMRTRRVYIYDTVEIALATSKCPKRVDPSHWKSFIIQAFDEKFLAASSRNSKNRKQNKFGHTLGRYSYARKQYELDQKYPEEEHTRTDAWLAGHERRDGSVLPSAQEKYDEVKAAKAKRNADSMAESSLNASGDFDDALTDVFGPEKKCRTRASDNHLSKKQYRVAMLGKAVHAQKKSKDKEEIVTLQKSMARMEDMMMRFFQREGNNPQTHFQPQSTSINTHQAEVGFNSVHSPSQNLTNLFEVVPPIITPTSSTRPRVTLLSRDGKPVAKGFVEIGPCEKCHGKIILPGEKKVWIDDVLDPDAAIYDRPQDGNMVLQDVYGGAYLIWHGALLQYT